MHKRFSSKGTQRTKSSKNLVFDPSKELGTGSPVVEAKEFFPGHQEFFFIFIMSADCFSFGIHLKNRLKDAILSLLSAHSLKGLERRLSRLQVFARFLGLLIFSPCWHEQGLMGGVKEAKVFSFDPGLPLFQLIESAWKERRLVITVPWVVEFLRMARWSPALRKSENFKRLLSLLLGIHYRITCGENESSDALSVNMQQVSLCFETLVGDIIGLERAVSIPAVSVVEQDALPIAPEASKPLDALDLRLSTSVLFTSNPHVEELFALLSSLTHKQTKPSGVSRKLTPYSIRGGMNGSSIDPLHSSVSTPSPMKSKRILASDITNDLGAELGRKHANSAILGKLVESFFHQHRDLKELCDFVVDQTLRNVATKLRVECVVPFLEKEMDVKSEIAGTDEGAQKDIEGRAIEASRTFLAMHVERSIRQSLDILCPPEIQPRVRDVATKLSISYAIRLGDATVDALVRLESKKLALDKGRQVKKEVTTAEPQGEDDDPSRKNQNEWIMFKDALSALRDALASRMWESRPDRMAIIVRNAKDVLPYSNGKGFEHVRGFLQTTESRSLPVLQWCLRNPPDDAQLCWRIAADYLGVISVLAETRMEDSREVFMTTVKEYFSAGESMDSFIELGLSDANEDCVFLCRLLARLMDVQIIPSARLQDSLIRALHGSNKGRDFCECFISQVHKRQDEGKVENEVSLAKLRQELENPDR